MAQEKVMGPAPGAQIPSEAVSEVVLLRQQVSELQAALAAQLAATADAQRKIAEALAARTEFILNISHELRTPLHVICSYASLGLGHSSAGTPFNATKYFRSIGTAGAQLTELVESLLTLASLERREHPIRLQSLDPMKTIDEIRGLFAPTLRAKRLTVLTEMIGGCSVLADTRALTQVLSNLLSNAINVSPAGGFIKTNVRCFNTADSHPKRVVEFSVLDSGPGVPPEEREVIFEEFALGSATRTGAGGRGMGLAICRRWVEQHGGRIWVEDGSPDGARFVFTLPG